MDVLQMMGRTSRPVEDERTRCILMYQQARKDFYKRFLVEGLPIKSHLLTHLRDYILAEIAVKPWRTIFLVYLSLLVDVGRCLIVTFVTSKILW